MIKILTSELVRRLEDAEAHPERRVARPARPAKAQATQQDCPAPGAGLEPCPRCGGPQRWETSHSRCEACHWITPCCEGAPL